MVHIQGYDHVGIRVSNRQRALKFYAKLGFVPDAEFNNERVAEVVTENGTRINLIFNGTAREDARNVLLDEHFKWPGVTHTAFMVERLDDVLSWAAREGVAITEGPVDWGRRVTCFLRDPDGNVLEFNELINRAPDDRDSLSCRSHYRSRPASGLWCRAPAPSAIGPDREGRDI